MEHIKIIHGIIATLGKFIDQDCCLGRTHKALDMLDELKENIEALEDELKEFKHPEFHVHLMSGSEIKIFGDRLTLTEKEAIEAFLEKLKIGV